jgi:hypothetical protein
MRYSLERRLAGLMLAATSLAACSPFSISAGDMRFSRSSHDLGQAVAVKRRILIPGIGLGSVLRDAQTQGVDVSKLF